MYSDFHTDSNKYFLEVPGFFTNSSGNTETLIHQLGVSSSKVVSVQVIYEFDGVTDEIAAIDWDYTMDR